MDILTLFSPERMVLGAKAQTKEQVLDLLISLQAQGGALADVEEYRRAVWSREEQGSTAVEAGVAVPHAKSDSVRFASLALVTLQTGVEYGAVDGVPSDVFFLIATPSEGEAHLEILSALMKLLMNPTFVAKIRTAGTVEQVFSILKGTVQETEATQPEMFSCEQPIGSCVLAVTACPTGIAHTYLAAEALERAGEKMGVSIYVETRGSSKIHNPLTQDEIASCMGVIVAADRDVPMERFEGKAVVQVPVSDGIHHPEQLIQKILDGTAPIYHPKTKNRREVLTQEWGHTLYKHLMNGVSFMLPFVIAGGLLTALSYFLDNHTLGYLTLGSNTPISVWLGGVGQAAFDFMMPVLAAFIAMAIAGRPGFMVGFVGGLLAMSGATLDQPMGSEGTAGFLGALIAGFVAGYLMLALERLLDGLPEVLDGIKTILIYPIVGLVILGLFMCIVNPFVGELNAMLYRGLERMDGESKVAFGMLLGGMMAVDMGGPFNKAAYVFGTSTLAALHSGQGSDIMAAVMVGGMVPPLVVALATTLFPNDFSMSERKSGAVNYILGLCFITEGAIPFAASDPLRVLPACVVGSSIAGGISMWRGCTIPAPHGGALLLPVMHNPGSYLLALVVGAFVGMILLILMKHGKNAVRKDDKEWYQK